MKTTRRLFVAVLAVTSLVACGPQDADLSEDPIVGPDSEMESNTNAVISGAVKGSTIQVTATDGVRLRKGPGTTYETITVAPYLNTANVLNPTPTNGFYSVNYQGSVGWTHGDWWSVRAGLYVNQHKLTANEEKWMRWIASKTMPRLSGTRDGRLTVASRVGWWSLKEGILGLDNPLVFSSGYDPYTDQNVPLAPLQTWPYSVWQVGIAGIQVYNVDAVAAENTMKSLYPGMTSAQILGQTAISAGFASGTSTYNAIVNSSGALRRSWVLRNHGAGFTMEEPFVTADCVNGTQYWCWGSWYPSSYYSPNKTEALESIREVKAILDSLAP